MNRTPDDTMAPADEEIVGRVLGGERDASPSPHPGGAGKTLSLRGERRYFQGEPRLRFGLRNEAKAKPDQNC